MKQPTVYLICGTIGVGKTTFSKRLETSKNAVRFSSDEWVAKFYGRNLASENFFEHVEVCRSVIRDTAKEFLSRNIDVILDFGLWKKFEREKYQKFSRDLGAQCKLYYLTCAPEEAKKRTRERNKSLPEGEFVITDEIWEKVSSEFEDLESDEVFEVVDTT